MYSVLKKNAEYLPEGLLRMLTYMERDNWLYHYKDNQGIEFSMKNVLNKAKYLDKNIPVYEVFLNNKPELQKHFDDFFPELLEHVKKVNETY